MFDFIYYIGMDLGDVLTAAGVNKGSNSLFVMTADELYAFVDKVAHKIAVSQVSPDDDMLSRPQVRELLHVTDQTLINWQKSGRLSGENRGGRVYYRRDDVMALK